MDNKLRFELVVLEQAAEFLDSLPTQVQNKINFNIKKIRQGFMDAEVFKKLGSTDIWEFRTLYEGKAYRLLVFNRRIIASA